MGRIGKAGKPQASWRASLPTAVQTGYDCHSGPHVAQLTADIPRSKLIRKASRQAGVGMGVRSGDPAAARQLLFIAYATGLQKAPAGVPDVQTVACIM